MADQTTPNRADVERDLTKLHGELKAARRMDSPNRVAIVQRRIDKKLDEWSRCPDPAGLASVEEFGPLG
jgi:hypothetical protein